MSRPIALVTGVGPGTGAAIARRFSAGGYGVAMLAPTGERLAALERDIAGARGYVCDVTDENRLDAVLSSVRTELGTPPVLIHNPGRGTFPNFPETVPPSLKPNFPLTT